MNFFEFKGIKIAGMATAVPDRHQKMSDYDYLFAEGEVEKFCAATGIYEKYNAYGVGTTTSDLCVAAANKLFEKLNINKDEIEIIAPKRVKSVDIKTMPYPGFPTDMQSIFGALLITAKGTSVITENIFESRYKYAQELIRMGAKINVEGRTAIIKGTKKIQGTNVVATDLRGGAALIMAGLYAKGITQIDNIHYILRGYEKIDEKLKKLGAKIHVEK